MACGIAVQFLLLAHYGASEVTDAFFAASTIPQLVIAVLVGAAINVIVPMFAGRPDDEELEADSWTLLSWTAVLLCGIAVLISVLAAPITAAFVPGLSPGATELATRLTVISAATLPLTGIGSVAAALHQGRARFVAPELIAAATNALLLLVVGWALSQGAGLILVAWLIVGRLAVQAPLLLVRLGTPRLSLRRTAVIDNMAVGMRPLLLSTSYFKLAPLIDRWLASFGLAGDISLLQVLQQVFGAAAAVASKSVVGPLTALLSTQRKDEISVADRGAMFLKLHRLAAVLCVGGFLAALVVVYLIAPRFLPPHQATRVSILFLALGGLYTAGFLGQMTAGWFYSEGDTATPARVGAVGFTIGLAGRGILFPIVGTVGIAISLSLNQIINWAVMYRRIRRETVRP